MAKLTARFDMKDGISKKMRTIRGEAEKLAKARDKINRPVRMLISVRDRATSVLRKVDSYAMRRFPKMRMMTIRASDRATPIIKRVGHFARSTLGKGYRFTIRANDLASRTIRNVSNFTQRNVPKAVSTTVRVLDLATRPLQTIASAATSTLGLLGVAGGIGGGIVIPIKMVAEREDLATSFEVTLGSQAAADQRLKDLTEFAGRTPLTRDEIFRSSRILQTFTGNALSTASGMELIGDVAVGTQTDLEETATWFGRLYDGLASGRPIGEATSRLQEMGAISGEARGRIEKLAKSGGKIEKIWPTVTKEFSKYNGMMEKMSGNMNNLLLGLKSFVGNSILMPWGEGLRDVFKPALLSFRKWRGEYSFVLSDMSRRLKTSGSGFAKSLLNPLKPAFNFIEDQMKILFPGEKISDAMKRMQPDEFKEWSQTLKLKFEEDPAFKKRYDSLEKYRDISFETRWRLVVDTSKDAIGEWWETTGRANAARVGESIGSTYGGFIHSAVLTLLGGESDKTGNPFIDAGITSGKSFVTGFLEALDPADLSMKIGAKLRDINVDAAKSAYGRATGNEEMANSGSVGGALIVDAVALGVASTILSKFKPLKDLVSWGLDKTVRRGKGNEKTPTTVVPPNEKPKAKTTTPEQKQSNAPPKKDAYSERMKERQGQGNQRPEPQPKPANTKTESKLLKYINPKNWTVPKGVDKVLKKLPFIGTALTAFSLFGSSKEQMPGVIGGLGGGMAGAAVGASLGSVVPIFGTAVGGIGGGILGAIGGEKLLNWIFGPKKASAEVQQSGSMPVTDGVTPIDDGTTALMPDFTVVNQHAQILATTIAAMSDKAQGASHNIDALTMTTGEAAGWVAGAFYPLEGSTAGLTHNIDALTMVIGESSGWIVGAFYPLSEGTLAQNASALSITLGESTVTVANSYLPLSSSGAGLNQNTGALSLVLGESSVVVAGAYFPLASSGPALHQNTSALSTTLGMASGWVATLNGIQSGAAAVKSALNNLTARINSVPMPTVSGTAKGGRPGGPQAYAKGTRFHPGGDAIVGDGGGAELMKFPNGRTALSPATDTLLNLPRGTEVLSHRNTVAYLNQTPAYADGIGFEEEKAALSEGQVRAATSSSGSSGGSSGSGLRDININLNGDNHYSNDMDAEKVGKIAYDYIKQALLNEEFEGGEMVIDV